MYGYIYLTTNLVNGRLYIGAHKSETFDKRYKGSGRFLKQAMRKHGWENFKSELLIECNSRDEMMHKEKLLIALYDAIKSPLFYNMKEGGEGYKIDGVPIKKNKKCSEIARKNISESHKGKKWSNAQRLAHEGKFVKEKNPMYGRDFSPETKILLSQIRKGRIWINNGETETQIPKDKFNEYSNQGYTHGRLKQSISKWCDASIQRKHCWVRKGTSNLRIYLDDLSKYLELGYERGRYIPPRRATAIESVSNEKDIRE